MGWPVVPVAFVFAFGCSGASNGSDNSLGGDTGNAARGDAETGDAAVAQYVAATQYCETIAPFFCDFYLRCGRMDVPDHAACLDLFDESCESKFESRYVDLEAAGLLHISQEGVNACAAHMQTVSCVEQIREIRGPCADIFEGTQVAGETCGFDFETFVCAPGTSCVIDLSFCGTCKRVAAGGESCAAAEVTCSPHGRCVNDICVTRKLVGESCVPDDDCELGASCDSGVCVGPTFVGRNQACDFSRRCAYGTTCSQGFCVPTARQGDTCPTAVCETGYCNVSVCARPGANEDTCNGNLECASGNCDLGRCVGLPSDCF